MTFWIVIQQNFLTQLNLVLFLSPSSPLQLSTLLSPFSHLRLLLSHRYLPAKPVFFLRRITLEFLSCLLAPFLLAFIYENLRDDADCFKYYGATVGSWYAYQVTCIKPQLTTTFVTAFLSPNHVITAHPS